MPDLPIASRPPAPDVPPVEHNGVRYSQVMDGRALGLEQSTGYLRATHIATGEDQWVLRVYELVSDPGLEQDVQEIYFRSMVLEPESNALLIEREFGGTFRVDLHERVVTRVR